MITHKFTYVLVTLFYSKQETKVLEIRLNRFSKTRPVFNVFNVSTTCCNQKKMGSVIILHCIN